LETLPGKPWASLRIGGNAARKGTPAARMNKHARPRKQRKHCSPPLMAAASGGRARGARRRRHLDGKLPRDYLFLRYSVVI
jgi:hypothetical protein